MGASPIPFDDTILLVDLSPSEKQESPCYNREVCLLGLRLFKRKDQFPIL